ncbi:hypothetical protein C8R44DRAFT_907318 [Mycena epipterygia]|nr:hypothetical protein C8R44DRAFT_907318 [Mycena epipterygia]
MHLNFLIFTVVSAFYAAALPTNEYEKRAVDPYSRCLNTGTQILQDIQSDTAGLTAKYNQFYAPFATKGVIDTPSDIKTLMGTLDMSNAIVQISVAREGQEAAYRNYFDVTNGIIIAAENFNDRFFSNKPNGGNPVKTIDNSLQWDDIVGGQYRSLGGSLSNLKHILQFEIINDDTKAIAARAFKNSALPVVNGWTVVTEPDSSTGPEGDIFKALLGTDNGKGAGYMLKDYRASMPGKAIQAIRVQRYTIDEDDEPEPMMIIDYV